MIFAGGLRPAGRGSLIAHFFRLALPHWDRISCATVGEPGWRRVNTRSLDASPDSTGALLLTMWPCHTSGMGVTAALCSARLRDGSACRSVATDGEFCAYHAAMADQLGSETVVNGDQQKRRNARRRPPRSGAHRSGGS